MRRSEVQFIETSENISDKKDKFINFPLKTAIKSANFTYMSLGKQLHLDPAYLCCLVNNPTKFRPSAATLEKLCNVLNKTPFELSYLAKVKIDMKPAVAIDPANVRMANPLKELKEQIESKPKLLEFFNDVIEKKCRDMVMRKVDEMIKLEVPRMTNVIMKIFDVAQMNVFMLPKDANPLKKSEYLTLDETKLELNCEYDKVLDFVNRGKLHPKIVYDVATFDVYFNYDEVVLISKDMQHLELCKKRQIISRKDALAILNISPIDMSNLIKRGQLQVDHVDRKEYKFIKEHVESVKAMLQNGTIVLRNKNVKLETYVKTYHSNDKSVAAQYLGVTKYVLQSMINGTMNVTKKMRQKIEEEHGIVI